MTWPGSPGAAQSASWGSSIAVVVRAAISSGVSWHIGPHAQDRLDNGNVMGPLSGSGVDAQGRLWVDLACDAMSVKVADSSTTGAGVVSRAEAATLTLVLYDPERKYDPANSGGPYWLNGHSRLTAGTYVEVTAEVLNSAGTGVVSYPLFSGLVDSWSSSPEPIPADRRATVVASGSIKQLTSRDYGQDDTPVGLGDTAQQRVDRILSRFTWQPAPSTVFGATSSARLAATDFQGSAWQNLGDTVDAEIGYVHVMADGTVQLFTREYFMQSLPAPALVLGCSDVVNAFDIATDLELDADEAQLRNAVYATRHSSGATGDTPVTQVVRSASSIGKHGGVEAVYSKTGLDLVDDPTVSTWAQAIVALYAYPEPAPRTVTTLPARLGEADGHIWRPVLGMRVLRDVLRVVWEPAGSAPLDTQSWVMGVTHEVTPTSWTVQYDLLPAARSAAKAWHIGPHPNDKLNAGNTMGWAA